MTESNKQIAKDMIFLTLIIGVLLSILLGSRPLTTPDEGRYGEIPRQMLLHHDYVTPRINNIKYFEKPPLFYWMQTANVKLFGLNEWSVRIATALMGLLGCLFTYFAGVQLFDRRTALLSAFILASSGLYFGLSRFVTLDITVAVFISGCILSFMLFEKTDQKKYIYGVYIFSALATLTKGFIGFILPGAIFFTWIALTNNWRRLKYYHLITGTILFLIIASPWHIIAQIRNPEFLSYYVLDQQLLRYFTSISGREQAVWFLPAILVAGFLPWVAWLPQAMTHAWKQFKTEKNQLALMLIIWPTFTFIFFWLSKSQLSPYILPMFPAMALLVANTFNQQRSHWINIAIIWVCFLIISVAALFKFNANDVDILFSLFLLMLSIFVCTLIYRRNNFKNAVISLAVLYCIFLASLNIGMPKYDKRSIKPLALTIKKIMQPGDMIASYNYLYLDLPVYLNRNVTIVNYYGELKHGIRHQDVSDVWINTADYWKLWRSNKRRIFMIMNINDYIKYVGQDYYKMYAIAKTKNAVLVSNRKLQLSQQMTYNKAS